MKTENDCQVVVDITPIIKWRTYVSNPGIEKVECTKETEKFVWVMCRGVSTPLRHDKRAKYDNFHDSWEEAKAFLIRDAERRIEDAFSSLESANSFLENVKGLRKTEEGQ